mgnify:CR=1 FL=1
MSILQSAWSALPETSEVKTRRLSSPYRSRPVDMDSPHWFINAVGLLRTSLAPMALLHTLQSLEARFGRRRDPSLVPCYQDRPLDLDLLLYDDLHLDTAQLILPHPRMGERCFVLDPLLEVLDEDVPSPFVEPLSFWVESCRCRLHHQDIERLAWTASTIGAGLQTLEKTPRHVQLSFSKKP